MTDKVLKPLLIISGFVFAITFFLWTQDGMSGEELASLTAILILVNGIAFMAAIWVDTTK